LKLDAITQIVTEQKPTAEFAVPSGAKHITHLLPIKK
jgi:hypothetical protein